MMCVKKTLFSLIIYLHITYEVSWSGAHLCTDPTTKHDHGTVDDFIYISRRTGMTK